jgi:hypothetical protein
MATVTRHSLAPFLIVNVDRWYDRGFLPNWVCTKHTLEILAGRDDVAVCNKVLNVEYTWILCTGQYKCEVLRGIIGSLHKIRNFTDVVDRFVLTIRGDR